MSDDKKAEKAETPGVLKVGYWVALTLRPDVAPLRCYVGTVAEVDAIGVRLTLVDWFSGEATGHDFFAPWSSITSALVGTPADNLELFGKAASKWQSQMEEGKAPPAQE